MSEEHETLEQRMLKLGLDPSETQWRVSRFAADRNLAFHDKIERSASNPPEVIWLSLDGATRFHYVDDPFLEQKYLASAGPDSERILATAREELKTYALDDALARAAEDEGEADRMQTASLLGLLAPAEFDPAVFAAFERLFGSPSPAVRQKGIVAAAYPAWPQFRPPLEALKRDDPDDTVRTRAQIALDAFDKFGVAG